MRYINLHTHRYTNDPEVLEIVNQYPQELDTALPSYSLGIHPWHIDVPNLVEELQTISTHSGNPKMLAIGECGLDKRIETPIELQKAVLRGQFDLALYAKKPLIIHCVAAFSELISLKNDVGVSVPMIIHGFSKSAQLAAQLIDNGFYLSFGKHLLLNPALADVFASVPDDRIFLETDTTDENIRDVYKLAAKYRGVSIETLTEIVSRNYNFVFMKS